MHTPRGCCVPAGPRTARALSEAVTDTLHDKYITRPANQPELQELLQKEPSLATVGPEAAACMQHYLRECPAVSLPPTRLYTHEPRAECPHGPQPSIDSIWCSGTVPGICWHHLQAMHTQQIIACC
jgi:hypothetical protein